MTENMNGHIENQSGLEQSMAEANGHTTNGNHNLSDFADVPLTETNGHTIDVKSSSEAPTSLNGSLSHKEEQKMAKKPLRAEPEPYEIEANGRKRSRRRCCCLSCAAVVVVIVVTIVVLALTVFKAKNPKITVTSMSVEGLEANVNSGKVSLNLTILAGMAVDNPNKIASFKHGNSTTLMIYRGATVGEAVIPAGKIKADKTAHKNVTMTIYIDQFMESGSNLLGDGITGTLNLTTRTEIGGRVKIIGIIKKHVSVRVECGISVNVSSKTAEMQRCAKNIKL